MTDGRPRLIPSIGGAPAWTVAALLLGCAASLFAAQGTAGIFGALLFALILSVAIVDWRDLIIPDWMNSAIFGLGLAQAAALADGGERWSTVADALARSVAFGGALLLVRSIYGRVRGREGLGLGDVKLAAAGGAWIGWTMLPVVVEIAALSALAIFLVAPRLTGGAPKWQERLPFGSFLAPAVWATWLIETLSASN